MHRRPPESTLIDTPCPYTSLFPFDSTDSVTTVPPLRRRGLDPHDPLLLAAEAEFGSTEQAIDDIIASGHAIVDKLGLAVIADDEQRRRLTHGDRRRKLDRSEEGRVGKEWVSTCRSRGSPYN